MPEANENQIVDESGRMGDAELLGLIRQYELASLGSEVAAGATISTTVYPSNAALTTLQIDRYNALNAFLTRPQGDEIENRSQVVLPVLRDTISWMLPQLMRMFAGAKSICRFDPENQSDEKQAAHETAIVNHVFMQQNNGVLILHDFFWDALLMRNGYAEVYTTEEKFVREERYSGLAEPDVAQVMEPKGEDEKITVLGQREYTQIITIPGQPPMPGKVFDLHLRRSGIDKKTCVTQLPPEEMRVTPRAREGMENIVYSAHITNKTRSDLISDGYDKALVNSMQAGKPNWIEIDALARNKLVDQLSVENPSDRAMQEIEVRKVILKVDYDGDGIAELRRVLVGGDKILENEVIEETPFVSCAPMRMPHRHTGLSIYDLVQDLQIISTQLWRQGLDNLKIANNTRMGADYRTVNFDDLMSSRPGGIVRTNGPPQNCLMPLEQPSNLIEQVIPALQYIDQLRSNRTGVGKGTMGLDPDELQNVTKGGQLAAMSAQTLILELIARLLAEGVKWIFLKIRSELVRNQDKPMEVQIAGDWVTADPSTWPAKRTTVSPSVGLGSGNREEMRANAVILGQAMTTVGQMGLVRPQEAFNGFKYVCESIGITAPEQYCLDPDKPAYQQWMQQQQANMPANPAVQVAQIKAQTEKEKQQSESQREVLRLESELAQAREKLIADQRQHLDQLAQGAHDASRERQLDLTQQHQDLVNNLIKIFGTIEASKAKAGADITGQMVGADIDQAASAIEHNQTMMQNEQTHGHAMQQQAAQSIYDRQQQAEGHGQTMEQQAAQQKADNPSSKPRKRKKPQK